MTTKARKRASSHAHHDAEGAEHGGSRLIKYMGASHIRVLEKGENFGGQLGTPLPKRVEWNLANNHMVDSEEAGLSDAAITLLLAIDGDQFDSGQWEEADEEGYVEPSEENTIRVIKEFADVTDEEVIHPSLAQKIYLGMSAHQTADEAIRAMEANTTPANPAAQSVMAPSGEAVVTGSAEADQGNGFGQPQVVEQTGGDEGNDESSKGDESNGDGDQDS